MINLWPAMFVTEEKSEEGGNPQRCQSARESARALDSDMIPKKLPVLNTSKSTTQNLKPTAIPTHPNLPQSGPCSKFLSSTNCLVP